jgi:hypothetical protein
MRAIRTKWVIVPALVVGLAGCANESLAGLDLKGRAFTGSYLAPSDAFTAGARAASLIPTAAPSQVYSSEQIKALANKTLQVEDYWVGPFCERFKAHYNFYNKHIDFNTGDEGPTTGGTQTAAALKQVQAMAKYARGPEQKDWAAFAVKFYTAVLAGKPTAWSGGWPSDESIDWQSAGWATAPDYEPNQPFIDLAAKQAGMAACLKLK